MNSTIGKWMQNCTDVYPIRSFDLRPRIPSSGSIQNGLMIEAHVFEAERPHGDTTITILAKGKCTTGRIWVCVRDDQPFAGPAPSAAGFYASSDRRGEHPQKHLAEFSGILQTDCYNGFNPLFDRTKKQMPATPAFCFAHARRKFFELADVARDARRGKGTKPTSPVALEAVKRIDPLFTMEREINGLGAAIGSLSGRKKASRCWVIWRNGCAPRGQPVALIAGERTDRLHAVALGFARNADDGRTCMTNNAAERALRGVACGRKAWLFVGSDRSADRAAVMHTLIMTARLNDVNPKAWLADVLAHIADIPALRLHEMLPWEWKRLR